MIDNEMRKGFYNFGNDVSIGNNITFLYPYRIQIGNNVEIKDNTELLINSSFNKNAEFNIKIDDYVFINKYVIFEAYNLIEVGKYVAFGPNVYVSDNSHQYIYCNLPIRIQGFNNVNNKVIIKDGAWIGEGAKILGDVMIGYGSVIGAGSVVTKDMPDHCVAVGNPAKVIKICDYKNERWINVKENLTLLNDILKSRGTFSGYDHISVEKILELGKEKDDTGQLKFKAILDLIQRVEGKLEVIKNNFLLNKFDEENIEKIVKELFDVQNLAVNIFASCKNINSKKYFMQNENIIYAFENLVNACNKKEIDKCIKFIDLIQSKILVEWKRELINILKEAGMSLLLLN